MSVKLLSTRPALWPIWYDRLTEIVRVAGAYLGVATMVAVLMILLVAPLRHKFELVHQAVLSVMAPTQQDDLALAVAPDKPWVNPVNMSLPQQAKALPDLLQNRSVTTPTLSSAVSGRLPPLPVEQVRAAKDYFKVNESQLDALENYIARKYRVSLSVTNHLIDAAFVVSRELGVDPLLILSVMAIESRFNPYAESGAGAQGLMQVMTSVHRDKFEDLGHTSEAAFNPVVNLRVGVKILEECIKRRGSEIEGLKCYVGATGPDDGGYSDKVQAERRRMSLAASLPMTR